MWICGFNALDRLSRPLYVKLGVNSPDNITPSAYLIHVIKQLPIKKDTTIQAGIGLLLSQALRPVYISVEWSHPGGYFLPNLLQAPTGGYVRYQLWRYFEDFFTPLMTLISYKMTGGGGSFLFLSEVKTGATGL